MHISTIYVLSALLISKQMYVYCKLCIAAGLNGILM